MAAEPDFTNTELSTELADVIKQEPDAGLSCSDPQQDESGELINGVDYLLSEEEDDCPEVPASQMPKPENNDAARELQYTAQELNDTVKDPRCAADWPLAHLWPVYIDNFRCTSQNVCTHTIRQYFGSKGLLVRWFFSLNDDYLRQFQQKANLYDGLVYFGSEEDARQAIQHCDHSIYNGYTMNVFPGRDPVYFPANRSIMYKNMKSGYVYSEEFLMRHMVRRFGGVRCVVKYDINNGAVEFFTEEQKRRAFTEGRQFRSSPVANDQTLQKQRFVEFNVRDKILTALRQNPNALQMNPLDPIFLMLQAGQRPMPLKCEGPPGRRNEPVVRPLRRGPTKQQSQTKFNNKMKKMRRQIERAFSEGREPKHKGYTKADKKRFAELYQQISKERKW